VYNDRRYQAQSRIEGLENKESSGNRIWVLSPDFKKFSCQDILKNEILAWRGYYFSDANLATGTWPNARSTQAHNDLLTSCTAVVSVRISPYSALKELASRFFFTTLNAFDVCQIIQGFAEPEYRIVT
jgi:hypothetical protein